MTQLQMLMNSRKSTIAHLKKEDISRNDFCETAESLALILEEIETCINAEIMIARSLVNMSTVEFTAALKKI